MADVSSDHKRAFGSWPKEAKEPSSAVALQTCLRNVSRHNFVGSLDLPGLLDAEVLLGVDDIDEVGSREVAHKR